MTPKANETSTLISKEETVKIPLSEYARLKLCESKVETIKRAVEADTDSMYGYSEKTSAVIDFLLEVKREKK